MKGVLIMLSGYAGRIKNKGNQTVEAVYKTPAGKGPKMKKGSDLRTGKSGKQINTLEPLISERLQNGTCSDIRLEKCTGGEK